MGKNFSELEIWQVGTDLAVDIFQLWEGLDSRGYYGLQDQMQRAAVSIPSNIAEGSERKSATEFVRYLYISKSSAAELRTQLHILSKLKIASEINAAGYIETTDMLSRKIQRLISVVCEGSSK
jgi:four helix bundle protein